MKTRRRITESLSHQLESLEGRSLMSATAAPVHDIGGATPAHPVVIADASFLSSGSDAATGPVTDYATQADANDLGGVWGSTPSAPSSATTQSAPSHVDLDDGAVDQMGDRGRTVSPADLTSVASPQWGAPAEYTPPAPPAATPVVTDGPAATTTSDGPAVPSTPAPADPTPADQTPVIIATGGAPAAETTFVWLDGSDSWLLTTKAKAAQQVVIASTFVQ